MKTTLLFLSVFLSASLFGQTWVQSYFNDSDNWSTQLINSSDGGFLMTGVVTGSIPMTGQIIKTNSFGEQEWLIRESLVSAVMTDLMELPDGNFIACGVYNWSGSGKAYLIKFDIAGNILWEKIYDELNDVRALSLDFSSEESLYLFGRCYCAGSGDIFIMNTNSEGNLNWFNVNSVGSISSGINCRGQLTVDGGSIIVGGLSAGGGFALKSDNLGNQEWLKQYNDLFLIGVSVNESNEYIACGTGTEACNTPIGYVSSTAEREVIIKINSNGETVWSSNFEDATICRGLVSISEDVDEGYILCGTEFDGLNPNGATFARGSILKVDSEGNELWRRNTQTYSALSDVVVLSDGYAFTGEVVFDGNIESYESLLVKTDENGDILSIDELTNSKNLIQILDLMGRETSFKPNTPLIYVYDDGSIEKVFTIE